MAQANRSVDIYLRISQARPGQDPAVGAHARQLKPCRDLAKKLGLTVRHVFRDTESATTGATRKGFEELLAARPPAIIIWHEDRLIRVTKDLERVIELGVNVYPVKSGRLDLSTPTGRAVARTVVAWAQYEGEHKSERQREANLQRAEAGQPWRAGRRAFGYAPDYSAVVEPEAALVREAFADVLAGVSFRTILRRWSAAGVKTTFGNEWSTAGLRIMLRNPTYCGRRRLNGVEVADLQGVPAIVDRDTFAAVQVIVNDPSRLTSDRGGRGPLYLLSGIARCGLCEAKLHAGKATKNGASWRVLRCTEGLHLSRKAEEIEDFVTEVVLARLRRKDAARLFRVAAPDLKPLQGRAAELRSQREALAADLDVDLEFAKARDRRLRDELGSVEAEIAAKSAGSALRPFASGRDPGEVWEELDLDARREVVRELVEVTVLPARRGRHPFEPASVRVTPRPAARPA
jgi:site-specific DNA recombinase